MSYLIQMSRKYKFHNPDGVYFVSFAVQGWVDVFTRNEYKNILIEQERHGLQIRASIGYPDTHRQAKKTHSQARKTDSQS
jgi:hypothetical protein